MGMHSRWVLHTLGLILSLGVVIARGYCALGGVSWEDDDCDEWSEQHRARDRLIAWIYRCEVKME